MKHFHTRIRQLKEILDTYAYPIPFANHLKQYYQHHKQLGGRDRKEIRSLSYAFFRISRALEGESFENIAKYAAIFNGYQVGDESDTELIDAISNTTSTQEKVAIFAEKLKSFDPSFVFPFSEFASEVFQNQEFQNSFLEQPEVWVSLNKGFENKVLEELDKAEIPFIKYSDNILSFQSEAKLTDLKSFKDGNFRIQDLSSQQTANYFKPKSGEYWWDSCAGAGGKSLALLETESNIHLYVSDIRESILNNLHERLPKSAKNRVNIFAADVYKSLEEHTLPPFDGIIIDAPCTGSGTWARNPENLYYFKPEAITGYQKKQLGILDNVYSFLKPGKPLIYITCSVFTLENEDVINQFTQTHKVEIEEQKYLEGYKHGSENMFLCRMIKKD